MIYLVTNQILPESDLYKKVTPRESLDILEPLRVVGLDTETEGFDVYTKGLLLLQLGCYDFQVVIDCTSIDVQIYKEYLESDRLFLGWNLKFDSKFLMHQHIILKNIYDGFIAEKCLWNGYPNGMHLLSLKHAAFDYLGINLDKTVRGQILWKGLCEDVICYAAGDVKWLEKIKDMQDKETAKKGLEKAVDFENHFVVICAYFEYCGVKIDTHKWKLKMESDNKVLESCMNTLNKWVIDNLPGSKYLRVERQGDLFSGFDLEPKCTINWKSSKQVIPLLKELGLDLLVKDKKTGEMRYSTEAKVLSPQKHKSGIVEPFIKFGEAQKVVSTYGQNIIDEINSVTGRLHTNYNQLGTDTNRLSSGGKDKQNRIEYVNMQNIPADPLTRSCFVSEPGYTWISCDYQGQESRLMAELSSDKAMLELFEKGKGDMHSLTAKMSYPEVIGDTPIEEIKEKFHHYRQEAKGVELKKNNSSYVNKWL